MATEAEATRCVAVQDTRWSTFSTCEVYVLCVCVLWRNGNGWGESGDAAWAIIDYCKPAESSGRWSGLGVMRHACYYQHESDDSVYLSVERFKSASPQTMQHNSFSSIWFSATPIILVYIYPVFFVNLMDIWIEGLQCFGRLSICTVQCPWTRFIREYSRVEPQLPIPDADVINHFRWHWTKSRCDWLLLCRYIQHVYTKHYRIESTHIQNTFPDTSSTDGTKLESTEEKSFADPFLFSLRLFCQKWWDNWY